MGVQVQDVSVRILEPHQAETSDLMDVADEFPERWVALKAHVLRFKFVDYRCQVVSHSPDNRVRPIAASFSRLVHDEFCAPRPEN